MSPLTPLSDRRCAKARLISAGPHNDSGGRDCSVSEWGGVPFLELNLWCARTHGSEPTRTASIVVNNQHRVEVGESPLCQP